MMDVYSAAVKDADFFNQIGRDGFPGLVGLEVLRVADQQVKIKLVITPAHLSPNGLVHAAVVVTLADTACGIGSIAFLPEGATAHATIELKCNFVRPVNEETIFCEAAPAHMGRTTQLWDARVYSEQSGKNIAHFRCTQMILW
jgi:uncharacterized protein (TIGR00369 family)